MAEELIDSYIDRNGVKGDTDFILSSLREVYGEFQKLQAVKVDMKGLSGLTGMVPLFNQATAGADSLATATQTVTDRMAVMNGKSKEFTDVLLKQTRAQKEAAAASLLDAKAKNEAAKAKQNENKATEQSAKAKEREKKLIDEATNDYLQLSKAYNEAALKAKNYALRLGESNPITKEAIKQANDLGNVLKKLDASVGQNQRNVGNYSSAFNGLGMSFAQVSRELPSLSISFQQFALAISNNLPMVADELKKAKVEIANLKAEGKDAPSLFSKIGSSLFSWQVGLSVGITLFTVYAKQITAFFSSLFTGSSALSDFKRQQEGLNGVIKDANKAAGDEIARLEVLYRVATNVTVPIKERRKAVDEIQKQYPEHFKNINDEIILQGKAAAAYDATKTAILESAKAMAVQGKLSGLAQQELDLLKEQNDLTIQLTKGQGELAKQKLKASGETGPKGAASSYGPETQNLRLMQQEIKTMEDRAATNKTTLEQIAKDREFYLQQVKATPTTDTGGGGGGEDLAKKLKEESDKRIQIAAELRKIEIQQDIDFNKAQTENEDLSLVERLQALQKYYQARIALIAVEQNTERAVGTKTAEELTLIDAKANDERLRLDRETYGLRDKLIKEFSKNFTDQEKKMQDGLAKLVEEGYKNFVKADKERTDKEKAEADKRKKIAEEEAATKKRLQQQLVSELTTLAFTALTANIENEKNGLQDQIDLLEEKKKKDIEVAQQTIANAQERAAAIATIEARANAQKEELQRKQRDLDVKKAQFDKAQAIARIIQGTAQAIIAALASIPPNPVAAALYGAIGAAQLATVIAQPIPRYKHGKNVGDAYEGPAIVDDGGKPEAIIRENGTVEIGGNTPRLTYVKSRDIVLPDASKLTDYVLSGKMGTKIAPNVSVSADIGLADVKSGLDRVVAAIKNKPELHLKAGESGLVAVWKYGASQMKYINENTNW